MGGGGGSKNLVSCWGWMGLLQVRAVQNGTLAWHNTVLFPSKCSNKLLENFDQVFYFSQDSSQLMER